MSKYPLLALLAAGVLAAACTEPKVQSATSGPSPALLARIELSDSLPRAGDSLVVRVRLDGPATAKIVSFTGRVSYDPALLRFVAELPIADGATRVSNPMAGLIRVAGVGTSGFTNGVLAEYRFIVTNPAGARKLSLDIDEMHDAAHGDASKSVVINRATVSVP